MFKTGTIAVIVTAATAGTLAAQPSGSTRSRPVAKTVAPRSTTRTSAQAPTCGRIAEHLVVTALTGSGTSVAEHAARARREMDQLERQCRDERWSAVQLACLAAISETREIPACIPVSKPKPIAPLAANTARTCDTVGPHVADLMIASEWGVAQDNIAVSVLANNDEMPAQVIEECESAGWTEDQLHCYAAATRFSHIIACNLDDD